METIQNIKVPTGNILVVQGEHGPIECLSLGDYGREHNVKADFLDLKKDPGVVKHTKMLPLSEKWVITISTQYGCSMGCSFCDVPQVGPGRNATMEDLLGQVECAMSLHPETKSGRINLHYARMGEPTFNPYLLSSSIELRKRLSGFKFHPVLSTMMPKRNSRLGERLYCWMIEKARVDGDAGLQISVNSTKEQQRSIMFNGNALSLTDIAAIVRTLPVVGRKIALNFAVASYEIDAKRIAKLFSPTKCMVKLTPMHVTSACAKNDIRTPGDATTLAPYLHHEEKLKAEGFDVLVFVASRAEDEGRITCGNAILSGTEPYGEGLV